MNEQNTNTTYPEQVKDDFEEYFGEQYHQSNSNDERYALILQALGDDGVTGNGSGSYYMNRSKARQMVLNNIEYIAKGISNEGWTTTPLEDFIANDDWETLDVIARYHTLSDLWQHNVFANYNPFND